MKRELMEKEGMNKESMNSESMGMEPMQNNQKKNSRWLLTTLIAAATALGLSMTALAGGVMPEAITGTGGVNSREGYSKLFDASIGTKWCTSGTDPYVIFKLPAAAPIRGYTIVTGNDNRTYWGRNPQSWTLYGCNADSDPAWEYGGWEVIDSVQDDEVLQDQNSIPYYFELDQQAPAYQYYLFQVDKKKGGFMQMAELILDYDGNGQVLQNVVAGSKGMNISEGYQKARDGKASTKWCTNSTSPYLIVKMSSPVSAEGYHIVTGNDNSQYKGRNPKSWTLYGSNADTAPEKNDDSWEVIESVENDTTLKDVNGTDFHFSLSQPSKAYRYFKFEVDERKSFITQMSEFSIEFSGSGFGFSALNGTSADSSQNSSGSASTGTLLCGSCAGRGDNHCFVCQGQGTVNGALCGNCGGAGRTKCTACNGKGHL